MNGALYRRFRPDTFDKVIGQNHIVRTLVNQIGSGNLSHAYLFTGTRGTGKTSTAKIFARAVNCERPLKGSACGVCPTCIALKNPSNLDIIEIDAASNNGVDEMRELKENVRYHPTSGKYKVYIIDEVHMLSTSAFNALLKTLEEPPEHVIFLLATTEAQKIPQTVLSRCIRFDFRLVSDTELAAHLGRIFDEIGQEYDREALMMIARHGEGSVRDTLSAADMIAAYANGKITAEIVEDALGTTSFDTLYALAAEIIAGDIAALLKEFDKGMRAGKNPQNLAKDLGTFFMNVLYSESIDAETLGITEDEKTKLATLGNMAERKKLTRAIEILTSLEGDLRYTTQPTLLVGAAFVKAAELSLDTSSDATLARLRTLEKEVESLKRGGYVAIATKNNEKSTAIGIAPPSEKLKQILESSKVVSEAPMFQPQENSEEELKKSEERRKNMNLWQSVREMLKKRDEFTLSAAASDVTEVKVTESAFEVYTASKQAAELLNDTEHLAVLKEIIGNVVGGGIEFRVCLQTVGTRNSVAGEDDKRALRELFGGSLLKK